MLEKRDVSDIANSMSQVIRRYVDPYLLRYNELFNKYGNRIVALEKNQALWKKRIYELEAENAALRAQLEAQA